MNDLRNRSILIFFLIGLTFVIYSIRLFHLQVMSKDYALTSEQIDIKDIPLLPSRGIIYERNKEIFVQNSPIFSVEIIPNELKIQDTTILEEYLGISPAELRKELKRYKGISRYQIQTLDKQIDFASVAPFEEKSWSYEGIWVVARNTRDYLAPVGAHLLGYINQVNRRDLDRDTENYYRPSDLIGISGVEKQYEKLLRGKKGKKTILVDNFRREIAGYAGGKTDYLPIEGRNIQIGIDLNLQAFGESLMQNKKGSIVAIEPSTGEILAFVSAPGYDPNLFSGGNIGKNYSYLRNDSLKPLINRPVMALYPPGSIFKMLQVLAGMSAGVITEQTHYSCIGHWFRNKGKPKCHGAHGSCNLTNAIKFSCNSYFAELYYSFLNNKKYADIHESYGEWHDIMSSLGVGHRLGVDIPNESRGKLPTKEYYDKKYGEKKWGGLTTYSNSIGQGEILMTPIQMANTAAIIANRGHYIEPHFLKSFKDSVGNWVEVEFDRVRTRTEPHHYTVLINAMEQVVQAGTGYMAKIDSITICGKTGTVENAKKDHSVFICFAPKDNPRIAVATIVENAGYGGEWAAPISSLVIEQYLKGKIKDEYKLNRILNKEFVKQTTPKLILVQ